MTGRKRKLPVRLTDYVTSTSTSKENFEPLQVQEAPTTNEASPPRRVLYNTVSEGENAVDQVKAYNIAINQFLIEKSEKNLTAVEKVLADLTPITWDLNSPDVASLVVNSVQLLSLLDYKNSITWSLVSMFQEIADSSLSNSKLIRDEYQLFPALARLLHSESSTISTHIKTPKLLQLMLLLAQDFQVFSIDGFMTDFVKDLLNLITGEDEKCQVSAGLILSSLLRNNYPVVRLVLAQQEFRKISHEEGAISLINETLLFRVEQADLEFRATPPDTLTQILNQICEALKLAFHNVDKLQEV